MAAVFSPSEEGHTMEGGTSSFPVKGEIGEGIMDYT